MALMFGLGGVTGAGPTLYHMSKRQSDTDSETDSDNPVDGGDEIDRTDAENHSDTDIEVLVEQTIRELNNAIEAQETLEEKYLQILKEGANAKRNTKRAANGARDKTVKFKMKALELRKSKKLKI